MSYSISAQRATKGELEIALRDGLAKVPQSQPVHEADIDQAFGAAQSFLALMQDDPVRDLYGSISGSIWKTDAGIQQVSVNVSFAYAERKTS
jgi:hypothetical protein